MRKSYFSNKTGKTYFPREIVSRSRFKKLTTWAMDFEYFLIRKRLQLVLPLRSCKDNFRPII